MHRLAVLEEIVERIRLETSHDVPDLAINILLSIGFREGLSITDLASKLDMSSAELYCGLRILTTDNQDKFNCAGLLYADHNDMYFLTRKGSALAGDLTYRINKEAKKLG